MRDGSPKRDVHQTVPAVTYTEFYRLLAAALRGDRDVPVNATDARDVLRIVELAIQSSKEGRTLSTAA